MADEPVLCDVEDGVARIRLNRPDASNALNLDLLKALHAAIMDVTADPDARCVLLTGEGKNFCGGGDVKDFASKGEGLPDYLRAATGYLNNCSAGLLALQMPVVCAVQGAATGGGGMGLVLASDLVIAGESARFMVGATRVGMAPDAGLSVTLQRSVGLKRAMKLVLENPMIEAHEALELGFVSEVVADADLAQTAETLAGRLAAGPPKANAATKRLLWSGAGSSVEAALADEARTVAELSGTADSREGLAAVIERRKPEFTGR